MLKLKSDIDDQCKCKNIDINFIFAVSCLSSQFFFYFFQGSHGGKASFTAHTILANGLGGEGKFYLGMFRTANLVASSKHFTGERFEQYQPDSDSNIFQSNLPADELRFRISILKRKKVPVDHFFARPLPMSNRDRWTTPLTISTFLKAAKLVRNHVQNAPTFVI